MSEQHTHEYHLLYIQPRIKEDILIARCDCGATEEQDAKAVFEEAHKRNQVFLFDFNNRIDEVEGE